MILEIVKYGHPVLRRKGARIETIDADVRRLIADMLETMYAAKGVGLAAQQVGHALQLTVIDVRGVTDRPSTLEWQGHPAEVDAHMPLVLINPNVRPFGETVTGPEGCLSFPEIYADIPRPESAHVKALIERGQPVEFRCGGLLARVVQHEVDHLNGILFIDRMSTEDRRELKPQLDELQAATKAALADKKISPAKRA
ncbi:MAG: peptide deformylase [Verrucomicrobiales bacterium]|nr:peptide deformylase [Verrucomicrobiales bacterium]